MRKRPFSQKDEFSADFPINMDTIGRESCVIIRRKGLRTAVPDDMELPYAVKDEPEFLLDSMCASHASLQRDTATAARAGLQPGRARYGCGRTHEPPMKTALPSATRTEPRGHRPLPLQVRPLTSAVITLLALGVAFGACAQAPKTEPPTDPDSDLLEGVLIDSPADTQSAAPIVPEDKAAAATPPQAGAETTMDMEAFEIDIDTEAGLADPADPPPSSEAGAVQAPVDLDGETSPGQAAAGGASPSGDIDPTEVDADEASPLASWLQSLRVSLKHEVSYKFASPKRVVNNRSSVRVEYSKALTSNLYVRLDTKLNLHWGNDHRARAKDEDPFRELVTREAYLQSSFGNTSVRLGYQILPWGVSEGGAITDEVSPRNSAEFFFVSLEESRVGQPMLTMDHFGDSGQWTAFFVPKPGYNRYPDRDSEYDIPGAFDKNAPDDDWNNAGTWEFGARWKRTFGKSDISLMAARLIDNDYLVRQQQFRMYGLTANLGIDNLLLRAEVALKQPRAFFARSSNSSALHVVESDQFDSSFGFDYSPGGRQLTYSAEVIWSRLLDWNEDIVVRERDEYSLVGSVSNRFLNDELTLSWLTIYTRPYTSFQHKFLSAYTIDDNSTVYFELFYPDERDARSGSWPYRDQKQFVVRYQYQF